MNALPTVLNSSPNYVSKMERLRLKPFWLKWLVISFVVGLVFLATMNLAPYLHVDEFMTVDLGRNILHPDTDWSVAWFLNQNQPVFIISFLGPVLQEFFYQFIGQYGPRISGLIGGIFAATMMVGWLLKRGVNTRIAFLLGLAFLLDPLFVHAYTIGRVDGWAIGVCLASCWVIKSPTFFTNILHFKRFEFFLAGVLAAVSFFLWPSVVFLYPLIILELINQLKANNLPSEALKRVLFSFILFCTGGIAASVLFIIPILPLLIEHLENIIRGLLVNSHSGADFESESTFYFYLNSLIEFRRVLVFSPFLFLFSIGVFFVKNEKGLLLALLVATVFLLSTVVYVNRVLYLLPYYTAAVGAYSQLPFPFGTKKYKEIFRVMYRTAIAITVAWAVVMSLVARQLLIVFDDAGDDRSLLYQTAESVIGEGAHSVLLMSPFEFYHAGRSMGWKMYRPYLSIGEKFSDEELVKCLPLVDNVIVEQKLITNEVVHILEQEGMVTKGIIDIYTSRVSEDEYGITIYGMKLRSLFHIYRQPYGPYIVYTRIK